MHVPALHALSRVTEAPTLARKGCFATANYGCQADVGDWSLHPHFEDTIVEEWRPESSRGGHFGHRAHHQAIADGMGCRIRDIVEVDEPDHDTDVGFRHPGVTFGHTHHSLCCRVARRACEIAASGRAEDCASGVPRRISHVGSRVNRHVEDGPEVDQCRQDHHDWDNREREFHRCCAPLGGLVLLATW